MKKLSKLLAIILSVAVICTTMPMWYISSAANKLNLWDVDGAPDQSGMEPYGQGFFSGEFTSGGNANYVYGQKNDGSPVYSVSPYGWRGYGIAANAGQRAGRYDYRSYPRVNYYHTGTAGFIVEFKYATRAVSRQIELEAGKSYTYSFWFKGFVKGFDIKALDQIYDYHVSDGDSIITSINYDLGSDSNAFSDVTGETWELITVNFTMPEDKSVANFILAEGYGFDAAFDEFLLVESDPYNPGSEPEEPEDPEDPEAPADPNKWLANGAPDQSGMEPYCVGNFSGEGGENLNYIYGQDSDGNPKAKKVSPYGWRGYGLAANQNQRAGRYDYNSTANYAHSGTAGFMVEFKHASRAVSRQIMLEGGKTYYFSFWFFGVAKGFKITALDQIYDTHQSDGENIAIANKDVTSASAEWSKLGNWTFVEMKFTLPEDKPVANFVLAEGDGAAAGFDEFVLLEKDVYFTTVSTSVNGLNGYAGGQASISSSIVDKDDEVTATATVDDGFEFDGWYVNGAKVSSNPVDTFTVTEDAEYKANYKAVNLFNYIENGDFEKDKQPAQHSQKSVYTKNGLYNTNTEDYDAANVHSGTASYRLANDSNQGVGNNWWQLQVKEGESYILKFWVKGQQMGLGIGLSDNTDFGLVSSWDGIENMFDPNMVVIEKLKNAKLSFKDWTEFTYHIDVPVKSDADDIMYLDILFATCGHTAYLDDMSLYNLASAVPTVYINGAAVHNNDYVVADSYEIAQDNVVNVTANTYNGLTFNGWYNVADLDNPVSTETTISYTQKYNTPDVVAKFTGLENLFTYAGAERVPYEIYNTAGWFWTANNGDGGMVGKSISNTEAHSGLQSYKLEYKYNHGLGRTVKLEAGKSYKLTFWYKATANNLYRFLIVNRASDTDKMINSYGATFDSDHLAAYEAAEFSLTATEWTQKTVVFNTAEGMDTVDIFFAQSGDNGDAFYIDDVTVINHDNHEFGEWSEKTPADCTNAQVLHRTCSICGYEDTIDGEPATGHTYDNVCDTTCNVCGYVRVAPHQYKTEWSSDKTHHWHECELCGNKTDVVDHEFDNACDTTCNTCGYTQTITHQYNGWSTDITQHWHTCNVCGEIKDTADHVFDNTCDTTCNICGYVRTVIHQYKTEWSNDGTQHWHECEVCGDRTDLADHEFNNACDTTCNICDYVRTVPHQFFIWSTDDEQHWYECELCGKKKDMGVHVFDNACDTTCNTCGYTRTITHQYKTVWSTDSTKHWHECEVCGDRTDLADHEFDNTCDTTCNICGYVRTITHQYKTVWSADGSQHWHECEVCGDKTDIADHEFDNACDTTCNVCGYVRTITHQYKTEWSNDGTQHWHECEICGDRIDVTDHAYTNACDIDCKVCGYVRTPPHQYNGWSTDVSKHWHECVLCGKKKDMGVHIFDNACDTTCNTCGYVRTITHQYKTVWSTDGSQHWHECEVCGDRTDLANHEFDNACDTTCNVCGYVRTITHQYKTVWSADGTQHWHECKICGDRIDIAEHVYSSVCDNDCNICDYVRTAPHQFSAWSTDDEQHWHECELCGETDIGDHEFDNDCDTTCNICGYVRTITHRYKTVWSTDGTQHWHECEVCGDRTDLADHEFDNACDTTCNVCGYVRVAPHQYATVWSSDETCHWHECELCKNKADQAEHDFGDDNICEICGYAAYTPGDLDGNEVITDADAVYLLMNTFFPEDYPLNQPGDFDGDGQVTDADAVYLLMYTFFPDDYPIVKAQAPIEPGDPGETEPDPFNN